jgi:hypothetical protein
MSAAGGGFPPGSPFGAAPPGFAAPGGFAPGGAPAYPQHAAPEPAFVLDIPADPTWQPIEGGDTLEKDGYYCGKIINEKVKNDDGKLQVIMTVELQDPDAVGKKLSKFMPNPGQTTKDTWWLWRSLMRSIYGTVEHAQQAMRYTPGTFNGAYVYFKTEAYADGRGVMRTGIGEWVTRDGWEEAQKPGSGGVPRNRWPAKINAAQNPGVGALPGGTGGLPGMPGGGLPGAPSTGGLPGMPSMPTTVPSGLPMPGSAPMQQAAPAFAAPPQTQTIQAPQAPVQPAFAFPPAPVAAPPQAAGPAFPPPPANGIPQPNAAGIAAGFPPPR